MNIFNLIQEKLLLEIKLLAVSMNKEISNISNITLEPPKNILHGDFSTNAAMVISKDFGMSPAQIAPYIIEKIESFNEIESASVAAPGFINIIASKKLWYEILKCILEQKSNYGRNNIGVNKKANVEFVSVNPTGPMHVGHARGAVFGDVLAKILSYSGYDVVKEYYINDAGGQIDILAKSAYLRYLEASGEKIESIPEGFYPGEYLIPAGKYLFERFNNDLKNNSEEDRIKIIRPIVVDLMMQIIKNDLSLLGVCHDVFFNETNLHEKQEVNKTIEILKEKNLIYKGILAKPKGKSLEDWEEREQILFKSTLFGDDIDRPLQKSNGEWTYFAADIAYMKNKIDRGFSDIIVILGADHAGYLSRIKAAISALSDKKVHSNIQITQLVNYSKNGIPFKMSKRAGNFISVKDVIDAVGKDITRFIMLTRKNDAMLEFDLEKVKDQSKDNPVFYVQYAHARCNSILLNSEEVFPGILDSLDYKKCDLSILSYPEDINLIKHLSLWPRIIEQAAIHAEPHRITFYLYDLASSFHAYWSFGKSNRNLRFIIENDKNLTISRIFLVQSIATVIKNGLSLLNINAVDSM